MDIRQFFAFTDNVVLDGLRMGLFLGALAGALVWPFFGASERVLVRMAVGFFGGFIGGAIIYGPAFFSAMGAAVDEAPPDAPLSTAPGLGPAFLTMISQVGTAILIGTYFFIMLADPPRFIIGGIYGGLAGMGVGLALRYGWSLIPLAPGAYPIVVAILVAGALSFIATQRGE